MISVVIAAAGKGTRMGMEEKKQFLDLLGKPILIRTLEVFNGHDLIDEIIIVTNQEDLERVKNLCESYDIHKLKALVEGGNRRQDSIHNALEAVKGDVVLIHDAARPFVSEEIITCNIEALSACSAVITGVASKDTIKYVENGMVKETLERSKLFSVQTPQSFKTDLLRKAYAYMVEHQLNVTDDSSLLEAMGYPVKTVNGSYENIKITTQEDLILAEQIIRRRTCE